MLMSVNLESPGQKNTVCESRIARSKKYCHFAVVVLTSLDSNSVIGTAVRQKNILDVYCSVLHGNFHQDEI